MSEMERRTQLVQKETEKSINETRGMVIGLAAVLASLPEVATLDVAKVKELSRRLTSGQLSSIELNRGVDLILKAMASVRSTPS